MMAFFNYLRYYTYRNEVLSMKHYEDALLYVENVQDELIQLIKDLCAIPSFSHHEEKKAKFIKEWFKKIDTDVHIDEKFNVILEINAENKNELTVFMAHIDTVFPDETGFTCIEKDGYLCAPAVGDDTANVAELMLIAKYLIEHKYTCPKGCLIVFNSCEEGLGNLDGSRYLLNSYKGRVKELYSFDGGFKNLVIKAVGSIRYKIDIETEGGHSYGAFGNKNAIALASEIISYLYTYKVPSRGRSTYNVGVIEGGTSVNTIAQNASFLFEFRSDHRDDLEEMKAFFDEVIHTYKEKGYRIIVEVLGERPCMGDVDEEEMKEVILHVSNTIEQYTGNIPTCSSGSTDCNMSYSLGISGCCFGGYSGQGAHTREEKIEIASLCVGMKIVMHFVLDYME